MKKSLIIILALLFMPAVLAMNLQVTSVGEDQLQIMGINDSLTFQLKVENLGSSGQTLRVYNSYGFIMSPGPEETFTLGVGESKTINLEIQSRDDLQVRGFYALAYVLANPSGEKYEGKLVFEIRDLKDVFEIGARDLNVEDNTFDVFIYNKEGKTFSNLDAKIYSAFFEKESVFDLEPFGRKTFTVQINNESDVKKLQAGFYTLFADVEYRGLTGEIETPFSFVEKANLITNDKTSGFIIRSRTVEQSNEGNTLEIAEVAETKNIISRLFSTFSKNPSSIERKGIFYDYYWIQELKPSEKLSVKITTNWTLPFIVLILVVVLIIVAKIYLGRRELYLRKRVSFVRAKGGEFALKITIAVNAKKDVERVSIVDRLPALVKVYEKFSGEQPKKVDELNRKIVWDFDHLEAGEIRMLSYIVYSKLGVLGRFALPPTAAFFEKDGKIKEVTSNQTFFVSEQVIRED